VLRSYLKKSKAKTPAGPVLVVQIVQKTIFDEVSLARCKQALEDLDPTIRFVLDLTALENVSSSFVGVLLQLHREAQRQGGQMVVCGVNPTLRHVMEVLRLDKVFVLAEGLKDAVAAVADGKV